MSAPIGTVYGTPPHAKTQRLLALAKYAGLELKLSDTIPPRGDTKKPEYLAKFPLARM
ncbi:hypothetical protein OC846_006011 [Tilletia horrida]|uniref:GST N-terminal domain-containing protein n=1 Tax=Tilletia horrida TaxID=155126 RepID=A0AAN6GJF7_9BASI|nr:hypothetical protein OC846_006011 [Tilletia horrida]